MQIFSLWCVSPKATGGLNFTTDNVGKILGISGANYAFLQNPLFSTIRASLHELQPLDIASTGTSALRCWPVWFFSYVSDQGLHSLTSFPLKLLFKVLEFISRLISPFHMDINCPSGLSVYGLVSGSLQLMLPNFYFWWVCVIMGVPKRFCFDGIPNPHLSTFSKFLGTDDDNTGTGSKTKAAILPIKSCV